MNLLTGNIRSIYFRYLTASFGSAMIVAIYSIVDCAVVGQYEGARGVAALATVAPVWNIIYSLGLLFGIGGAVLMSTARGLNDERKGNAFFTSALAGVTVISLLIWAVIFFFPEPMLSLFGADEQLLPLAMSYMKSIRLSVPLFVFGQFLAAFLRNDNAPGKATAAVLCGGFFNIFGDLFFVFGCRMGIFGAGLATALGQLLSLCIMLSHFTGKKSSLRLVRPPHLFSDLKQIVSTGFSTFFIDVAMGALSLMFNNQIMRYLGSAALAVYGVIININILVQSCAYGIGQAAQPLISINYGAGNYRRISQTLRLSLFVTACISLFWSALTIAFPEAFVSFFMKPSPEVSAIAPSIMRCYFLSFLLLPLNVFSTYYFQAILKPVLSFMLSVLRGLVLSGLLIYTLPLLGSPNLLWLAMPLTEFFIGILTVVFIFRSQRKWKQN